MIHIRKLKLLNTISLAANAVVEVLIDEVTMTCRVTADTIEVPSAPSGLTAVGTGTGIILNWDDNPVIEQVTSYIVQRSTNEGGPFVTIGLPVVSSYTDALASNGVTYFYRVIAVNSGGESEYTAISASFEQDVTAPGEVTIVSTELTGATAVTVTWTKPTDIDFAGSNFYRSTTENGTYTKLNTTGLVTSDNATDSNATAGSTWWYKVTTVDVTGNESTGVKTSKAVPASDTTAPTTPGTPTALDIHTAIHVVWTPNTETDLASYKLYRSDDAFTTAIATGLPLTPTSYDDTTAVIGTPYTYKVQAIDGSANASTKSGASNSATRTTAPTAGNLDAFVKAGEMVPCVAHARGVDFTKYRASTDGKTITFTETNDFDDLANGTPLTARYEWNMASGASEPQGKYATARGFNYAHAYDVAGTYTIQLTRTDDTGVVKTFTSRKTFLADTRRIVYCSSDGSSSSTNNGGDKASPVSLARANAILGSVDNVKVFIRRGDNFNVGGTIFTLARKNQMISTTSAFVKAGQPVTAHPIFTFNTSTGGSRSLIKITSTATNGVVEGFSISQTWTTSHSERLRDQGVEIVGAGNHLVRDVTFGKIGKPLEVDQSGATTRYVLCEGCSVPNDDSMIFNFLFVKGGDFVFLGLSAVNSTGEHILRVSQCDRLMIGYCNLTNKELSTSDTVKTVTNFQQGAYCYIYKNTLTADIGTIGANNAGTCQIGPLFENTATLEAYCRWCVMEENFINAKVHIVDGASEVMVRNNVITKSNSYCFEVKGHGEGNDQYDRPLNTRKNSKVYILNNTCINNGRTGQLIRLKYAFNDFVCSNNLLVAAQMISSGGNSSADNKCMYFGGFGTTNSVARNVINLLDQILVGSTGYSVAGFNDGHGGTNNAKEAVTVISSTGLPTFATTPNRTLARPIKGVFSSINGTARSQSDTTWTPGAYQL